jgi:hypothetical protein
LAVEFATYGDLQRFTSKLTVNEQRMLKAAAASRTAKRKDTFLSHSSKDAEYLPGVITLLENHGASVYCDLADERMPENPNPETAVIVKQQIKSSKRLVVFVTTNSKDSRWVPWELGIGDSELNPENVALLPTATTSGDQAWARQEYLGLYRHIVWGQMQGISDSIWMVYDYRKNTATKLSEWCRE